MTFPVATKRKALDLSLRGFSADEIGNKLSVHSTTVRRWRRNGRAEEWHTGSLTGAQRMVVNPSSEKDTVRKEVLRFILKHAGNKARVATLPGNWKFERVAAQKTKWDFICAERDSIIANGFKKNMPGRFLGTFSVDLGDRLVHGLASTRARQFRGTFSDLAEMDKNLSKTSAKFVRERYLDWNAVWLDACSYLGEPVIREIGAIENGLAPGKSPVCVTIMASRENGIIASNLRQFDERERDDIRIALVCGALGERFKHTKTLRYRGYHGLTMLVVMGLLEK